MGFAQNAYDAAVPKEEAIAYPWQKAFVFPIRLARLGTARSGAKTAHIEPGSPWENGYCEIFHSLREAQNLIERWCLSGHCYRNALPVSGKHYNTKRPHSALVYLSPTEFLMKTTAPALEILAVSTLPLNTKVQPENSRSNQP